MAPLCEPPHIRRTTPLHTSAAMTNDYGDSLMRETITELIVGLAISLAIVAVAIGAIEIGVDRYVDGSRASSPSPQPLAPWRKVRLGTRRLGRRLPRSWSATPT
jgi:hypothetical protein